MVCNWRRIFTSLLVKTLNFFNSRKRSSAFQILYPYLCIWIAYSTINLKVDLPPLKKHSFVFKIWSFFKFPKTYISLLVNTFPNYEISKTTCFPAYQICYVPCIYITFCTKKGEISSHFLLHIEFTNWFVYKK